MKEVTGSARLSTLLYYGVMLLLFYLVFRIFEPFLVPLGWAVVLVVCFYPWHKKLEKRWGPGRAAAVSTLCVTLLLVVPALALLGGFVREAEVANRAIQEAHSRGESPLVAMSQRFADSYHRQFPSFSEIDPLQMVARATDWLRLELAARAGNLARNAILFLLDLFVMLFALFYLFRDADGIVEAARRALPFDDVQRMEMLAQSRDLISASVTASFVISLLQGLIGGVSFKLVGLPAPLFWGVVMAFFALLPLVGSWIIWVPAALWLLTQGRAGSAVTLVITCGVVAGGIEHFVRPILLSGRARMSPLLVFISVLGGIAFFGMLGFVLGPIVVATAASVLGAYTSDHQGLEGIGTAPGVVVESRPGRH